MEPQSGEESSQKPPVCPKCQEANKKKRHKLCNACTRSWHLGCVRLSRAQAAALNRWLCPECLGSDRRRSRQRPGDIPGDSGPVAPPAAGGRGRTSSVDVTSVIPGDGDARPAPVSSAAGDGEEDCAGSEDLVRHLAEMKKSRKIIPRIPRGARIPAQDPRPFAN